MSASATLTDSKKPSAPPAAAPKLSERIGRIEISATMAVTAAAAKLRAEGAKLVDFGAGEPHFATPRHIKDAAIAAIEANFSRYTVVSGIAEVRKAIVERHATDFGSSYTPEEAVFTTGGKLALFNAIEVLVDHGDEVILPVPYWVSYKDIIQYAGGKAVYLETAESENFRVTADAIERAITPRTKAIILNSPSNPSGAVISRSEVERIVRLAHSRGIYVMLDECYAYLIFNEAPFSGASVTDAKEHLIVLGSLSKTYAMTGWRAGFALGPKAIISAMSKLQSQSTSSTAAMVQKAAIAALTGSQECVCEMRADYIRLRDTIVAGLRSIPGITCTMPEGAFYAYPNVSGLLRKSGIATPAELTARLLHEAGVVVVPGEPFGTQEHIRLSYAVSHSDVEEGLARLRAFVAKF
jgi:aspartate aminotransferase